MDIHKMAEHLISAEEMEQLALALGYGSGDQGFTDDDYAKVVSWAREIRMSAGILQNVLRLEMSVTVDADGELAFALTPRGERSVRAIMERGL